MAKIVKFKKWECRAEIQQYQGGNPAIKLIDIHKEWDNLVAIASTNIPGLAQDEVAIKDYSENGGMYDALLKAEVILPLHRYTTSGYVERIPVCRLRVVTLESLGYRQKADTGEKHV